MLAVDNVLCTPALQRPLEFGADLVIHSATKYLDGQGRVLGGAVLRREGAGRWTRVFGFLRTAGPTLSPFNAWVILKGMETLELRMLAQSERALELARWLEKHPKVARVYYPGLDSHPQHALAMRQQRTGGARRVLRREGRQGGRLEGDRLDQADLDHRQPGRREDHHHASGDHDPRPHHAGGARRRRHHATG